MGGMGFWQELKRRHVYRVAVAYVVVGWVLIQAVTQVFPVFRLPDWIAQAVVLVILVGFPIALVLAWAFDVSPGGGIRRINAAGELVLHDRRSGMLVVATIGLLIAALAGAGYWWRYRPPAASQGMGTASLRGPDAAQRNPRTNIPDSVAGATPSGLPAGPAPKAARAVSIPAKSVAVLPFENLSADKNNAYFAAGMQDLILTKLADVGDLKVIARTSTEQYTSHPDDLKTIGEQLGVATILEGSVQKAGNQVLINVQLIDAKTDAHIWAQSYQRKLDNIFGVEGEVAGKVAKALNAELTAAQTTQLAEIPTTNPAAYDLFLRADFQARRADITFDPANLKAAIPLYRQAVDKDPQFALAYARLAQAENNLAELGGGGLDAARLERHALSDGERAVQLAPNLPASQLLLANSDGRKGDFTGAMQHISAALVLRPNDADALIARALVQDRQGQFDAAIASYRQVLVVDPRNPFAANQLGGEYMLAGDDAEAERWFRRAIALDPDSLGAQYNLAKAIVFSSGDVAQALLAVQGNAPLLELQRVRLLTLQRKYRTAITLLDSIPDSFHGESFAYIPKRLRLARLYRLAGDAAQARALVEHAPPKARARLGQVQTVTSVSALQNIAEAELDLGNTAAALHAVSKAQGIAAKMQRTPWVMVRNASLYAQAKRPDLAVPVLAKALATSRINWQYAPVLLWLDPVWDPIRNDPRFRALLKKYAKFKPAVTDAAASATVASSGDASVTTDPGAGAGDE